MTWQPPNIGLQLTHEQGEVFLTWLRATEQFPELAKSLDEKLHPTHVYVCAECGDPFIQLEVWQEWNGEADGGGDPPGGTWCPTCGENDIETETRPASEVEEPKR